MKIDIHSLVIGLHDYGIAPNAIMGFVEKILDAELDRMVNRNDALSARQIAVAYNNASNAVDLIEEKRDRLDILI